MRDDNSTIRGWLSAAGFDWEQGTILYQPVGDGAFSPGWTSDVSPAQVIDSTHPILDEGFDCGYGAPQCPRFFARDAKAVYFPGQYDGATWCERVVIDLNHYIDGAQTPYPGGR